MHMLRRFTPFIALLLLPLLSFGQSLQHSLIIKKTATWCVNCGTWGWGAFKDLIDDNPSDRAIWFAAHYSGDLQNQISFDLIANYGGAGQPIYYLDGVDQFLTSDNLTQKRQDIQNAVNVKAEQAPLVTISPGLLSSDPDQKVYFNSGKVTFNEATDGNYHLAFYLVEDNVVARQTGQSGMPEHPMILRSAAGNSAFGDEIASGAIDANTEVTFDLEVPYEADWDRSNFHFYLLVWKQDGSKYVFVNGIKATSIVLNTEEVVDNGLSMELSPTITDAQVNINLEANQRLEQTSIDLFDLNGRVVSNIFSGNLASGVHSFSVDRSTVETAGIYLVGIRREGKMIHTEKIVFQ